ncbi:MAG: hypothetical protein JO160_07185, partial [Candidatus Eremiobacteraeota bacterium]|nr:hypothetical protein [Candidatus Eremiobacteraeota bacterium]
WIGAVFDRWRHGRRLNSALNDALVHFKGLVEYRREDLASGGLEASVL